MTVREGIADHLSVDEVKMKMMMTAGFLKMQKWLVIYNAIIDPRPISEIARHTGLSEGSVLRIIAEYNDGGPESIELSSRMETGMWFRQEPRRMSV